MASLLGLDTFSRRPIMRSNGYVDPPQADEKEVMDGGKSIWIAMDELIPSVVAQDYCGRFAYPYEAPPVMRRVSGYAFRGADRDPDTARGDGGFWCPMTWDPNLVDRRLRALGNMARKNRPPSDKLEILKGYRNPFQTSVFASPDVVVASSYGTWTYVFLVEGALNIETGMILIAGGVGWEAVVAYRNSSEETIWVRDGFPNIDPKGWASLQDAMSFPKILPEQ